MDVISTCQFYLGTKHSDTKTEATENDDSWDTMKEQWRWATEYSEPRPLN